jgi:Fe-S oxidoreductase
LNKLGSILPSVFNFFVTNKSFSSFLKKSIGFAKERSIPKLQKQTLTEWARKNKIFNKIEISQNEKFPRIVYFFNDEFTNYNDTAIGIKAILLLQKLGYKVIITKQIESGRTYLSKGLLKKAEKIAENNVKYLQNFISENAPLIGVEPSAILTFRDEYPDIVNDDLKEKSRFLAKNSFMFDEFFIKEIETGNITKEQFTKNQLKIKLHGHCQQKAVASTNPTKLMLSFPENYKVEEIPSGCCGMAGSFGYEKEHYDISMKVGSLVLFPEIEKTSVEVEISAPGTSCRHQIKDGTGRIAKHPIEILWESLL